MNDADKPLGVNVPPVGVELHVTPPPQDEVAFTLAVNVDVAPVFIVVGFAVTLTALTVHVGGLGVLAVLPLPHPES
jgi:hypothetical protein